MADTSSARPHDVITIVGKVAINGNFTNNFILFYFNFSSVHDIYSLLEI